MIAIPEDKIAQARAMLDSGKGVKPTARATGLSRYHVMQIRDGRFRSRESRHLEPARRSSAASRCPTCGGMVLKPCWLCHVRAETYGPSLEPQFAGRG